MRGMMRGFNVGSGFSRDAFDLVGAIIGGDGKELRA
jgi:hypothetical protein